MTRVRVHVKSAEGYEGEPQIVRELEADDDRCLRLYLHELVNEVPRDESELEALVQMFAWYENPDTYCDFRVNYSSLWELIDEYSKDVIPEDVLIVGELAGLELDIDVEAHPFNLNYASNGGDAVPELMEYLKAERAVYKTNVEKYRERQVGMMKN